MGNISLYSVVIANRFDDRLRTEIVAVHKNDFSEFDEAMARDFVSLSDYSMEYVERVYPTRIINGSITEETADDIYEFLKLIK